MNVRDVKNEETLDRMLEILKEKILSANSIDRCDMSRRILHKIEGGMWTGEPTDGFEFHLVLNGGAREVYDHSVHPDLVKSHQIQRERIRHAYSRRASDRV